MNKYRCKVCSYIYDPAKNDNIAFDDLPDDWTCPVCGAPKSEFEVVHNLGEEYTGGEEQEKHVPVIEQKEDGVLVKVGSVAHPMEEAHYISAIELYEGDTLMKKKELEPGDEPVADFKEVPKLENPKAFAYCNIHGVWES